MAIQKGIIKLRGTIGDITFYKTRDGHMAREKGGIVAGLLPILHSRGPVKTGQNSDGRARQVNYSRRLCARRL